MSTLERAIAIAAAAHAGQVDKLGESYILHPVRVMLAMKTEAGRIVGVLHDVVEDCPAWPLERIAEEGFEQPIIESLHDLTRVKGELYAAYIDHLIRNGSALSRAVKIRDLQDNLSPQRLYRLPDADADRLGDRYRAARLRLIRTQTGEF